MKSFKLVLLMMFLFIFSQLLVACDDDAMGLNNLKIKKRGNGAGQVISLSDDGIDCGDHCWRYYKEGTQVTLRAEADQGSEFVGWSGDGCSGLDDCTLTINDSRTVFAHFDNSDEISSEIWASRGGGFIIELNGDKYKWYEATKISRFPLAEGIVEDNVIYYNGYEVADLDHILRMCNKIEKLPVASVEEYTDDPEVNFEIFWHTFEQYYAFFNLMTETTWKGLYDKYRSEITQDTTDKELWDILSEMIKFLNDGHTHLFDFEKNIQSDSRSMESSPSYWMLENQELYISTIISYLDSFSREENEAGNGNIFYGTIDNKIGYINILSYAGYGEEPPNADFSLPSFLNRTRRDQEHFPHIIDDILGQFSHMDALIIDLRFNYGGTDELTLQLANRLISQRRLSYSHHIRTGEYEEFDALTREYSEPEGVLFLNKPVIVLTSNNTLSAGDIQAMVLKDLPNVTLMGETTFGIFANLIPKQLPNRWMFTLSTERYYSASGEWYEQIGISPHIEVSPDEGQLFNGHDNMLDAAIEHLGTKSNYN